VFVPDPTERLNVFRKATSDAFNRKRKEVFELAELIALVNQALGELKAEKEGELSKWPEYTADEAKTILEKMEDENIVMFRDKEVFRI